MSLGNERGMVLLLVLVVVALLSALLSEFAFSTLVDLRLPRPFAIRPGPNIWPVAGLPPDG